jgi:PAS domain-containing protein
LKPTHPLPVHHSWPLYERDRFFELGQLHRCETLDPIPDVVDVAARLARGRVRIGQWECDLADNDRLNWSDEVYDIFGIPRGEAVRREEAVALYAEPSRAAMEKLRAYAIRHRRGFTLDVEIRPVQAPRRWMRLIAAPVCEGERIVKLQGLKFLVPDADGREF